MISIIEKLVQEINMCIHNECYMSALISTMVLPDVCAKVEYPDKMLNCDRYKKWCSAYLLNKSPFSLKMPADLLYSLRCNLLHEGDPSINNAKCKVGKFSILIQKEKASIINEDSTEYEQHDHSIFYGIYNIDLFFLCEQICNAALDYYNSNKQKFSLYDGKISNIADRVAMIFNINDNSKR